MYEQVPWASLSGNHLCTLTPAPTPYKSQALTDEVPKCCPPLYPNICQVLERHRVLFSATPELAPAIF